MEGNPDYTSKDDNPHGTVTETNGILQLPNLPGSYEESITHGKLEPRSEYLFAGDTGDLEHICARESKPIRELRTSAQGTKEFKERYSEALNNGDPLLASTAAEHHEPRRAIFADAEAMKKEVRERMLQPEYNVKVFYKKEGLAPIIATSPTFEILTLVVIGLNSLWLWIDSDLNDEAVLLDAAWPFQVAENTFCVFFSFEWFVRFLSFEDKRNCLQDAWFVFDSVLVGMMVFETWIMTLVIALTASGGGGMGNTSVLRLLRLMRLTRISRLARLLRAMPELLVMIKGMLAATRSVALTILLLVFILYVFGIVERLLSNDTEVGEKYFSSVPTAMGNLVLHGALLDNVGAVMEDLSSQPLCAIAYVVVIMLAALTMMNMLVGVLCEVVSAVSATEKEEMAVSSVRSKITEILKDRLNGKAVMRCLECKAEYPTFKKLQRCPACSGELLEAASKSGKAWKEQDLTITKEDFVELVGKTEAVVALKEVGIDAETLIDYAKIIFQSDEKGQAFDQQLSLQDFMNWALQLRSTNQATVKDISDLRKFIHEQNTNRNVRLRRLIDKGEDLEEKYSRLSGKQRRLRGKVGRLRMVKDIQGRWYGESSGSFKGSIAGSTMTWHNGNQSTITFDVPQERHQAHRVDGFKFDVEGFKFDVDNGRLRWDTSLGGDGIWIREATPNLELPASLSHSPLYALRPSHSGGLRPPCFHVPDPRENDGKSDARTNAASYGRHLDERVEPLKADIGENTLCESLQPDSSRSSRLT